MEYKQLADFALCARTLGIIFYYQPNNGRANTLITLFQSSQWEKEWPFIKPNDCLRIKRLMVQSQQQKESLQEAYQRLFIGPYALPAAPWGSVYLDKENVIFGNSTIVLREWLRNNHINVELQQNEPEDHVGLLLLLAAWIAENTPKILNKFLEQHVLPWVFRYFEKMQLQSGHAFYEAMSILAEKTLLNIQQKWGLEPERKVLYL